MKKQLYTYFLLLFSLILFAQESVFVKSSEIGNGVLCERAGECFVITPLHVVENTMEDMTIFNKDKIRAIAEVEGEYDSDLAVLRIMDNSNLSCKDLDISDYYFKAFNNLSAGTVEYLDESGVYNIIHVDITYKDDSGFTIIPQKNNTNFIKGMSGSSFYFNYKGEKILAGMLMSIEEGFTEAFVLQIDDIMRILSPFFDIGREDPKKGPKRIGVVLIKDNSSFIEGNNQLVANINKGNSYKAYSKFSHNDYVESKFDNIVLGESDLIIPKKLQKELDQLFLGDVSFEREKNRKNMFIVRAKLNANIYSTDNFNLINSISFMGKGLAFDEKSAEKQALKSLLTNIENQFK